MHISGLEKDLQVKLHGQHLVQSVVLKAVQGFIKNPWVQQTTDSVLSWLVWNRKELCGPDSRRQPVPGWYKEWMCAFVHCPIPFPSRETGGRVQGEQRFNFWHPQIILSDSAVVCWFTLPFTNKWVVFGSILMLHISIFAICTIIHLLGYI